MILWEYVPVARTSVGKKGQVPQVPEIAFNCSWYMAESMSHRVKATKEERSPLFEDLHKQGFGFQDLKYKALL